VSESLHIGPIAVSPPVVLAPMAGVTDVPFRTLCRRFGAGLYVNQMITARGWLEAHPKTRKLAEFGPDEWPRSIQLYGTDPESVGEAVRRLVGDDGIDHIDMNFGCPVPKVTRHGGGAALPLKTELLRRIVRAAVSGAGDVPVSIKFRKGVTDDLLTFLETGRIAEDEGCAAVALHARTAEQFYSGKADWSAIGELKQTVSSIPVLGTGDIWEAGDALAMMVATGCDGVVIGRGCLGRPWLFSELAAAFRGETPPDRPNLGQVAEIMLEHAALVVDWTGTEGALRTFRKHALWYLTGFPVGGEVRRRLGQVASLDGLAELLGGLESSVPFPLEVLRTPRSHSSGPRPVVLPDGYLDDLADGTPLAAAAGSLVSGG
jgi:nifR3 family TIM-barrel protein